MIALLLVTALRFGSLCTLHDAVTVFHAQENARKTLECGDHRARSRLIRLPMRDLINRGAMTGPRMFVAGYGLQITGPATKKGRQLDAPEANGVPEVMRVAREQIAGGAIRTSPASRPSRSRR